MRTPLPDDIPLMCRGPELDRILADLQGPAPVAFVVAGAAGVGKTRLVREAARRAAGLGFATARAVTSPSGASIPFGPFAGFLPDSGHSAGDLLGLLMQASRLAGLAPEARAAIDVLALGEPIGLPVLDKLTDPGGLEEAEARGFVSIHQDGWRTEARLAHPLYGEAVRQSLPTSRRRRIAASLALAIESAGARRRDDLLRLGRWQLDAGGHGDPVLLTRAAKRAQEMFDMDLSAKLAQVALDSGGGAQAGLMLGTAKFRAGHHAEAEEVLARTTELCVTDDQVASIASARAYNLGVYADPDAAAAVLDKALAVITDELPRLRLLGRLATNRLFASDPEGALAAAQPVLAGEDDRTSCQGSYAASVALAFLGRGDEAVSVAYAGLPRHRRALNATQLPEVQLIGAVFGHAASGRFAEAEIDALTAQDACLAVGDKEGHATGLFMSAWVLIERGQLGRAASLFVDAASVNREINDPPGLRWCLAGISLTAAMSGHIDSATSAAAEFAGLPVGPMTLYEDDLIERSKAWVSACTGDLPRAREIPKAAADHAATAKLRIAEARLLHDIARLGQPELAAPRLGELAGQVEGNWVPALAGHAAALVSADPAAIEESGRVFDTLGAGLLAAEAYTAAAARYRSAGQARPASAAARRAVGPGAEHLTRREREIAELAAAGVPSREIAERLFLSVRTVDNHLQNAYTKLGVTSREELAAVLPA